MNKWCEEPKRKSPEEVRISGTLTYEIHLVDQHESFSGQSIVYGKKCWLRDSKEMGFYNEELGVFYPGTLVYSEQKTKRS